MTHMFTTRVDRGHCWRLLLGCSRRRRSAQSTMVRGKVIDAEGQARRRASPITIEFTRRRRTASSTTKTDKSGEFVQLLTESGEYRITATDPKLGTASNDTARRRSARRRR